MATDRCTCGLPDTPEELPPRDPWCPVHGRPRPGLPRTLSRATTIDTKLARLRAFDQHPDDLSRLTHLEGLCKSLKPSVLEGDTSYDLVASVVAQALMWLEAIEDRDTLRVDSGRAA